MAREITFKKALEERDKGLNDGYVYTDKKYFDMDNLTDYLKNKYIEDYPDIYLTKIVQIKFDAEHLLEDAEWNLNCDTDEVFNEDDLKETQEILDKLGEKFTREKTILTPDYSTVIVFNKGEEE